MLFNLKYYVSFELLEARIYLFGQMSNGLDLKYLTEKKGNEVLSEAKKKKNQCKYFELLASSSFYIV